MDSRDIFRRFFGFPNRHPSAANIDEDESPGDHNSEFPERGGDHIDEGLFGSFFGDHGRGLEGMFEHFQGDMFRQMEALHRQMEDMMKGFGPIDFPPSFEPPSIQPADPDSPGKHKGDGNVFIWSTPSMPFFRQEKGKSPRDYMLKEDPDIRDKPPKQPALPAPPSHDDSTPFSRIFSLPHWNRARPEKMEDTDLDGKISEDKILDLIKKPQQDLQPHPEIHQPRTDKPRFFSAGKSVSITTVRGADGKVEQKRVVRDSSGHEESTVTRSLGDKSYTVTTVTEGDGRQERHENYQNMDEKDLPKFENQWNNPQLPQPSNPADGMLSPKQPPGMDRRDVDVFSKLFGWRDR